MKYLDLTDSQSRDVGTLINRLTNDFDKEFGFGLTITEEGQGILETGLTLRENGPSPFIFTLDEANDQIKIEVVLSRRLQVDPTDLLRYQRRYKRRSKKYGSFCNTSIRIRELNINLQNNLDPYFVWFDEHDITHDKIVDQLKESRRLISIMLDIRALHEFKVFE